MYPKTTKRRKNALLYALVFMTVAFTGNLRAQLSGSKTIGVDYVTLAAAVTDINTQGVSGPLTINIPAGYTETAPLGGYVLTATGTSANTITFQKSGAGANPLLTAYAGAAGTPGTASQDGVFRLIGSDYVTINGIDITDPNVTNPSTMEFGYALYKASANDGCQNNTIKNCVITLNRLNNAAGTSPMVDGSVGIIVMNALSTAATTALTPSVAAGSNSNNKFYSNTIQNCNIGIAMIGFADVTPFSFADTGNDIGGTSTATGNTILNFGGGAATNPAAGVRTLAQYNLNVSFNTINNNNGSGVNHATTLRGIYVNTAVSANVAINSNTLTIKTGATTSQVSVIENLAGATAASNTVSISNNLITGCASPSVTSGAFYGIYNNGASAAVVNISANTFTNNTTNATTGATYLLYNTGAATNNININNNNFSHSFIGATAYSGSFYNLYNSGGTVTTNISINNNSWSNITHPTIIGTGGIYYLYNSGTNLNITVNNNTWNNLTLNHSGANYLTYLIGASQVSSVVDNNSIVTGLTRLAASGSLYCLYLSNGSLATSTSQISNNNFSTITSTVSGTGSLYLLYASDGYTSPYSRHNIYNNTFSNINYNSTGFCYGLYTYYLGDGGTTSTGSAVYNNTITNVTTSGSLYGFYTGYSGSTAKAKIYNNTLNNFTSNGAASTLYGTYFNGYGGLGFDVYKNKIYNIQQNGATGTVHGMYVSGATTLNLFNNIVGAISTPSSTNTNAINGLYVNGGTAVNAYNNTIWLNATSTSTTNFGTSALYVNSTPSSVDLRNNIFVNTSTAIGTGSTVAHRRASATITNYATTSNNNLFYAGTPGANNLIYADPSNMYQTMAVYQSSVTGRDAGSVSLNPSFLSTVGANANFLHIDPTVMSAIESGGTNNALYADDFDGDIRQGNAGYTGSGSSYDIGADEFNGLSPAPVLNAVAINNSTTQCTAISRIVTATVTPGISNIASVTLNYSFNGVAQTPIAMTGGNVASASTWSATIPVAVPVNANVTWNVSITDGSYNRIQNGTPYFDEPIFGTTAVAVSSPNPVCAGSTASLTLNIIKPGTVVSGTGTSLTSAYSYPTAFGNYWYQTWQQYLFKASELQAMGLSAGNITSLAFNIAATPNPNTTITDYNIKIASTTNSVLSTFVTTGLNNVFGPASVTAAPGLNTITLTTPYNWDGVSNIVIDLRQTEFYGSGNATTYYTTTSYNSVLYAYSTSNNASYWTSNPAPTTSTSRPNITFGGNTGYNGSLYSWTNGINTYTSATNPTTVSVSATNTFTGTATVLGCNTSAVVSVSVIPLPSAPFVTNSAQCGLGTPAASLAGGAAYNWYASPTATTVLQTGTSSTYTTAINATTTWYVTSTDGTCESTPRTAITATVNTPVAMTANANVASLCVGGTTSTILYGASTNASYTYSWSSNNANSGLPATVNTKSITVTPTLPGTYSYTVTAVDGPCTAISTVTVALNDAPTIIASATPSVICSGANVNLGAQAIIGTVGTMTIGTGSTTNSSSGSPFYHGWGGAKVQYIFTAAELAAQGLAAGNITSIGLNITSVGIPYAGFALSIGATTQSVFPTANALSNVTQVYVGTGVNNAFTPVLGVNNFPFSTPFNWDGVSNVVISICWSNATTGGTSSAVKWDTYTGNRGMYIYSDSQTPSTVCSALTTIPASGGSSTTTGRPQIYFTGLLGVNIANNSTFLWNPGSIATQTATVNPVNSTSVAATRVYTVSVTNTVTGCSNSNTVSVLVNALPQTPVATNAIRCGFGVPTASVSGGVFYNWYATSTSPSNIQASASPNFTSSIGSTTTWYVASYNGVCESATRTAVTQSVTIPDVVTANTSAIRLCVGSANTVTLTAVKTGTANNYSYTWSATPSAGSGIASTLTGSMVTINPSAIGNFVYNVTAVDGLCTAISTVTVARNPQPGITTLATPSVICSAATPVNLTAQSIDIAVSTATVGSSLYGTTTSSPYNQGAGITNERKVQYLYTKAELNAAGIYGGNITDMKFNATTVGSGAINNFTIKMGHTSTSALTTLYQPSPINLVYGPYTYSVSLGANVHSFDTPFLWDGNSNVLIEICHDAVSSGSVAGTSSSISYTYTSSNSTIYSAAVGACTLTTGSATTLRPLIAFTGNIGTDVTSSNTYTWNPGAMPGSAVVVNPVNTGSVVATNIYTVSLNNPLTTCSNTGTVAVVVHPIPTTPVVSNATQCGVAVPTASVSGGTSYLWYSSPTATNVLQSGASPNYSTSINTTTSWYVTSINSGSCTSPRAMVTQSVTIPDAVTASASTNTLCPNTPLVLTAVKTGSANTYAYTWTSTSGSGITTSVTGSSVTVTPPTPGTYTYVVTAIDGACTAVSTKSVTVIYAITVPPIVSGTSNPICVGNSVGLSEYFPVTGPAVYTLPPAVSNPTADEDVANITIMSGTTTVINNSSPNNSLVGTIGTATGVVGSYSDFTAYGPFGLTAGTPYTFTVASSTSGTSYYNALAIYIDYNRNGVFTDVGEQAYTSAATTLGAHSETGSFTVPSSAFSGLTRMRVISHEGLISSPTQAVYYGEYEEYMIDITSSNYGGGSAPAFASFVWSNGASTVATTSVTTQTPTVNTNYVLTATDVNGCVISSAPYTVTVNPLPSVLATTSNSTVCSGNTAVLSATGATSYTWSTGSTVATTTVTPTSASIYTVTGTNANGCVKSSTVAVGYNVTPTVSVNSGSICIGGTFTMTPTGATSYVYSNGSSTATPSVNTTYTVTGTTSGCSSTAVSTVTVNIKPTVAVNSGSICSGNSFTMTPTGASTYVYSNGSSVATPTANATYTVTGTNTVGCSNTAVSSVTVNATPTVAVNSGSICAGSSFTMVPTGATSYVYSSGSAAVTPSATTVYTVTGSNTTGCSNTALSTVTVNAIPSITIPAGGICTGGTFTITPSGAATYTYSSGSAIVSPSSTTSYTVTGTSAQGCVGNAVTTVTVSSVLIFSANSGSICTGQSFTMAPTGAVSYTYSSGSPVVTPSASTVYTITGASAQGCLGTATSSVTVNSYPVVSVNSGSICSGNTFTMTPTGATSYVYSSGSDVVSPSANTTYTVTGTTAGCSTNAVSTVTVYTTPTVAVNSGSICEGSSFTMTPTGAPAYSYSNGSAVITPTVTDSYTVTGTSLQGCSSSAVATVTVNAMPVIVVNSGGICTNGTFTMTPTGASTYTYSSGSAVVSPSATTSYTVTGASAEGCVSNAVATVTVSSVLIFNVNSGAICAGESFTMTPTGAASYTYSSGSDVVTPSASTVYTITGASAQGCLGTATSSVTVNALPTIAVNSGAICSGNSFTMTPTGAVTYTYSGGSDVVTPSATTDYTVTGTDANGCTSATGAISSVTVNPSPVVSATASQTVICNDGSSGPSVLTGSTTSTTYTWSTGVNTLTTSVTPTVTTTYTFSASDNNGCAADALVTVTVNDCTGIKDLANSNISIYPNPTNGIVNIAISSELVEGTSIEVYDAIGKLVMKQNLTNDTNTINLSQVEDGMYMFKIMNNNRAIKIGKVVKQ